MPGIRTSLAAILALIISAAGCGNEDSTSPSTTTATPSAAPAQALWPEPGAIAQDDPVAVARSFVETFVGVKDPAVGEFREGEPRAGEVDVSRRGEDGSVLDQVMGTISLRQLDGEAWSVTSAQSPEVELTEPGPLDEVATPVAVAGRGRGFEGNIVLELRRMYSTADTEPLAREAVTAGSAEGLEPFRADLAFTHGPDPGSGGSIVALTGSGIAAAGGFAAIPVRF